MLVCAHDNVGEVNRWGELPTAEHVDIAVDGLRMLADPTRLRLLWLLCGEELDVTTLTERLGVARPAVSQHLAKLRMVGLIVQRRDGRRVVSRARDHHVGDLLAVLLHDAEHRGTIGASSRGGPRVRPGPTAPAPRGAPAGTGP